MREVFGGKLKIHVAHSALFFNICVPRRVRRPLSSDAANSGIIWQAYFIENCDFQEFMPTDRPLATLSFDRAHHGRKSRKADIQRI